MLRLGERLGMTGTEIGQRLTSAEIMEYMAADALDRDDRATAQKQAELAARANAGAATMTHKMREIGKA